MPHCAPDLNLANDNFEGLKWEMNIKNKIKNRQNISESHDYIHHADFIKTYEHILFIAKKIRSNLIVKTQSKTNLFQTSLNNEVSKF